jgi:hypothetical protein
VEWAIAELPAAPRVACSTGDGAYDQARPKDVRERLGQVFTPPELADALARLVRAERPGAVLDPAAGDGSLLRAVAERRWAHGEPDPAAILNALWAWDIDPEAAALCRVTLVDWGLRHARGPAPAPLNVAVRDALDPFEQRVADTWVCNPPYLEAKRMGRAQPGLRERLKGRFDDLVGAFDLYLAFALLALDHARVAGFILPNKVCQGRYARRFRERVQRDGRLAGLLDVARVRPRPFPGTSVYPVLLHLEASATPRMARCTTSEDVRQPAFQDVPRASLDVGGETPWFVPFDTWPALAPLFAGPRLGDVAQLASTCSFHKRGLREEYVTPDPPASPSLFEPVHPYLGGPSRTRMTEIAPFQHRWAGWWIRYAQGELKSEHRNPLPPLDRFRQPKAIFNQHDRRMSAWADVEGRFVTKDVYPIAWPTHPDWTLHTLVAVLNSTVFTALYNTVFQGIVVGGETYHYLPAFLRIVPVPAEVDPAVLDPLVAQLQAEPDPMAWEALDQRVAEMYGVSEADRRHCVQVHLSRVGAPTPGDRP